MPALATATLQDHIHGGLAGAVIGDALGSLSETMSRREIRETYGWIDDFQPFRFKPFGQTRVTGAWTDDSSLIVYISRSIIAHGGATVDAVVGGLLDWSDNDEVSQYSGPTTRQATARLRAGEDPAQVGRGDILSFTGTSNGGGMKAAPAGWMNPGDVEGAARTAALICLPSHNTNLAIAGAAAIASACAAAMVDGASVEEVLEASITGAKLGNELGLEQGREVAGPSIAQRIQMAADLAVAAPDFESAVVELADRIGSSLATADSVPAAIGLFVAARGDINLTAIGSANIGDDTDTVGTMATAVSGTFGGRSAVNDSWYDLVSRVNNLDLDLLSHELSLIAGK